MNSTSFDIALLLMRLVVGALFIGHGSQKLFGWFGGYGVSGTAGWLESIGLRPGRVMAVAAGAGELIGGLLLALGLATPVGAMLIAGVMIVAIVTIHAKNGPWLSKNGYEYNLVLIAILVAMVLLGPGSYTVLSI